MLLILASTEESNYWPNCATYIVFTEEKKVLALLCNSQRKVLLALFRQLPLRNVSIGLAVLLQLLHWFGLRKTTIGLIVLLRLVLLRKTTIGLTVLLRLALLRKTTIGLTVLLRLASVSYTHLRAHETQSNLV